MIKFLTTEMKLLYTKSNFKNTILGSYSPLE